MGNNEKETIDMFKKAGFTCVYNWYTTVAYACSDYMHLYKVYLNSPSFIELKNQSKDEKQAKKIDEILLQGVKEAVNTRLKENKPLIHDIMCIVAIKNLWFWQKPLGYKRILLVSCAMAVKIV